MSDSGKKNKNAIILGVALCGLVALIQYRFDVFGVSSEDTSQAISTAVASSVPAPERTLLAATEASVDHQPAESVVAIEPSYQSMERRKKTHEAEIERINAEIAESKAKAALADISVKQANAELASMRRQDKPATSVQQSSAAPVPYSVVDEDIRPESTVVLNGFSDSGALVTIMGKVVLARPGSVIHGVKVVRIDAKRETITVAGLKSGRSETFTLSMANSRNFAQLKPIRPSNGTEGGDDNEFAEQP